MDEQAQAEQRAIEEHVQEWARRFAHLRKISTHVIAFNTWEEEEAAGEAAWEEWDKVFRWLEAHGVYDQDIVYDEQTEQATFRPGTP